MPGAKVKCTTNELYGTMVRLQAYSEMFEEDGVPRKIFQDAANLLQDWLDHKAQSSAWVRRQQRQSRKFHDSKFGNFSKMHGGSKRESLGRPGGDGEE